MVSLAERGSHLIRRFRCIQMEEAAFHRYWNRYHILGVMRSNGPLSVHEWTESIGSLGFIPFLYHSDVNNCLNGGVTAWEENRIIPQRNHSYRYLRLALSESPETILTFPESLHFSISNPFLKYLLLITDPTVSQTPIPQASIHSLITPYSPPFPSPPACPHLQPNTTSSSPFYHNWQIPAVYSNSSQKEYPFNRSIPFRSVSGTEKEAFVIMSTPQYPTSEHSANIIRDIHDEMKKLTLFIDSSLDCYKIRVILPPNQ